MAPGTWVLPLSLVQYIVILDSHVAVGASDAFEEALKLDPANSQAKSGLAAVKKAIEGDAGPPGGGLGNMFNDPQLFQKLANNPKTRSLLADPQFMQKLQRLQKNPGDMGAEMQDPRFLQVMGVLLGIDMSFGGPGGESGGMPDLGGSKEAEEDVPMPDARPTSTKPQESAKVPPSQPETKEDSEPEDEEAAAKKQAKEKADQEKLLGTEKYKKREFDVAIEHYDKAWSLCKDITYLTNKSAAQFEKGDYQNAIETCKTAIEEGREVLADFKIIAK